MYIHFATLIIYYRQPSQKSLTLRYFFGNNPKGQSASLMPQGLSLKVFLKMEKETNIILRVSPSDKKIIQDKANEAGASVSEYARKMLLSGSIIKIEGDEKKILNGIANNLNQLTRHANSTGIIPVEVAGTLRELIEKIRYAYRKR
jgi:hypothetical protein